MTQCTAPGCTAIRDDAPRRAWEDPGLCAKHRQQSRQQAGACLNCAAQLKEAPELNALTGKQLHRNGVPQVLLTCMAQCGYSRRPPPKLIIRQRSDRLKGGDAMSKRLPGHYGANQ